MNKAGAILFALDNRFKYNKKFRNYLLDHGWFKVSVIYKGLREGYVLGVYKEESMRITIESPTPEQEDEIIVRCRHLDDRIFDLINALKNENAQITGYLEDKIVKLLPGDIYYFESVDNKVFAYTVDGVYEVRKKLYEIEKEFEYTDMVRISKSAIVNLEKLEYLRPIFNGRFEARLKNGEKIIISRQYVAEVKKKLDI